MSFPAQLLDGTVVRVTGIGNGLYEDENGVKYRRAISGLRLEPVPTETVEAETPNGDTENVTPSGDEVEVEDTSKEDATDLGDEPEEVEVEDDPSLAAFIEPDDQEDTDLP